MKDVGEVKNLKGVTDPKGFKILSNNIKDYEAEYKERKRIDPDPKFWKGKKVLITGINGFVGSHLSDVLVPIGAEVHGLMRFRAVPDYPNIKHIQDKLKLHTGDITNTKKVNEIFESVKPDVVFHLAAESFVPTSFDEPTRVVDVNIGGTINLLEAARKYDLDAFHVACSSEQYGLIKEGEIPVTEENPFRPMSVYAITKCATEYAAKHYHRAYGIPAVITRTFNHTGPRRGARFVTSVITSQVAMMKKDLTDKIIIGNMDAYRDFTDVRDITRGYMLAVEKAEKAEPYVLCSGKCIQIRELVNLACNIAGVVPKVEIDKSRMRASDVPILVGSYAKAKKSFGWEPTIPITKTVRDMIEFFKKSLS
jgi:GDP-4-dehydro-6-deoxy-D-mannose reductase